MHNSTMMMSRVPEARYPPEMQLIEASDTLEMSASPANRKT